MDDLDKKAADMMEAYEKAKAEADRFWQVTYKTLSWEDKLNAWIKAFQYNMRMSGESGNDEYIDFTPEYYQDMLKIEPEAKKIINAMRNYIFLFDTERVLKQMGLD